MERNKKIFAFLVILVGATSTVDAFLANYFYEVYNADAVMRGFLEFPRELPGVIQMFLVGSLAFLGNTKKAMISQLLLGIGFLALGLVTPPFGVMCIFLFLYSLGAHLYMPLHDAISVELAEEGKSGKFLGEMNSIKVASTLVMTVFVYFGFRYEFLDFNTPILIYIIFGVIGVIGFVGFYYLSKQKEMKVLDEKYLEKIQGKKFNIVFRKDYKFYYVLATLNGVQKQIMLVFGPWVLIELLSADADTIILLNIIASAFSIYALKYIGIMADKLGIRKMMFADAFTFVFVYAFYGLLCGALISGKIQSQMVGLVLASAMFVFDRISMNFGMVRTLYLNNIAVEGDNIVDTISLGISMDHVVAICCAMLSGYIWKYIGPQYVFYLTAILSLVNVFIAKKVKINE